MIVQELVARLGLEVDEGTFKVADAMMGLAKGGMLAIGAAAAAAAVGLAAAVARTATYADGIEKAAQRTGIGVEALQALQYAAERADVGAEGLQTALNFMAKRGVKDFEAELRRAADELAAMPDGGEKAARAMQLFGKQGAALIPMLNKGSAGLDEMTTFAREAGIVLGEDSVASGAALKDTLEELQGYLRGIAYTIAGPMLKPVREWLASLGQWFKANRVLIGQHVERSLTLIGAALAYVFRLAEPVVDITLRLNAAILESKAAMYALGAVAAWLALPFLAPVAAIGLLLMAIEEVWGWITGKRKTLLEDAFGPFAKLKESLDVVNPEDSGMVKAAKAIGQALSNAYDVAMKLRSALGFGTAGPTAADQAGKDLMSPDRAVREKAVATLKGMGVGGWNGRDLESFGPILGGVPFQSFGGEAPSLYAPASPAAPSPATTGASVSVAQLVVNVPGGDAEAIAREVRGALDRELRAARPAVVGP